MVSGAASASAAEEDPSCIKQKWNAKETSQMILEASWNENPVLKINKEVNPDGGESGDQPRGEAFGDGTGDGFADGKFVFDFDTSLRLIAVKILHS